MANSKVTALTELVTVADDDVLHIVDVSDTTDDATGSSKKVKKSTIVSGLATSSDLTTHTSNVSNPHSVTATQVGLGNVDNTSDADKPISTATQTALDLKEDTANKGVANGYAELDASGTVPTAQLPAFVDDVLEYTDLASFPATGETGKIYVALDTNKTYRWSGSAYVEISSSLVLGETSSTAYRGDRGKTAYDHSQLTSGNPHSVTLTDVGGTTDHTALSNIGTNTHAQIDTHLANTSNPHSVTSTQVGSYSTSETDTLLSAKEDTANKVIAFQATPDDTHYASEKLVKDSLDAKASSVHTHTESDITDLVHNATQIQGKNVSATAPTDGQVLKYDLATTQYVPASLSGSTDADAVHLSSSAEISTLTEKVTPVSGDLLIIEDSASSNVKKKVQIGNLPSSGTGEANTASNVGVGGVGVYKQKTGVDLEFKNINAGSSKVTITDDTANNEIDIDVDDTQLSVTESQISDLVHNASKIQGVNVSTTAPSSSQTLLYNSINFKWEPTTLTANKISDFDTTVSANTNVSANTTHSGTTSGNPHNVTASDVGADPAGTDNSTDVTLAGTYNYLTILGQVITLNQIDLTTDVTGVLPDANVADDITLTNITQITNRSHTSLSDIGTNTHAQIDSHISNTSNPHSVVASDVISIGTTAPASPATNDLWVDTT